MLSSGCDGGAGVVRPKTSPITYKNIAFVDGVILWISSPRSEQSAQRLAAYFESNPDRYLHVEVAPAEWDPTLYRVRALPVSEAYRQVLEAVATAQQERNADRYEHLYRFQSLGGALWRVWGRTGVYQTSTSSCTCQHWQVRLRGTGVLCCHIVALRRRIERGQRAVATPIRRFLTPERIAADFD